MSSVLSVEVSRSQLEDVIASHLHAMRVAGNLEMYNLQIGNLPKDELITIQYNTKEVQASRPV